MAVFNIIVVTLSIYVTLEIRPVVSIQRTGIAHAIPGSDLALGGTPMAVISGKSRFNCLRECLERSCSAFNYGLQQCELLSVYLCEDVEVLTTRANFKYYDVETGDFVQMADYYSTESGCLVLNRCSPKCYEATTITAVTTTTQPTTTTTQLTTTQPTMTTTQPTTTQPTTTTTQPTTTQPTTTTTQPTTTQPTTTTTQPTTTQPTTTTTQLTTTTTKPTTSTTTQAVTTTTQPITTTTQAPTTTTTQAAATTPAGPPGPGDVGYSCFSDSDCTNDPNSYCQSLDFICTCVAGYSHHPSTKSCVTACPGGNYGSTYSLTTDYALANHDVAQLSTNDVSDCITHCNTMSNCASFTYDWQSLYICYFATVTKHGFETDFIYYFGSDYYQRDCA